MSGLRSAGLVWGLVLAAASGVAAQSAASPPALDLSRARELAHALVAERARVHGEQQEVVRPAREAVAALREALQAYLAAYDAGAAGGPRSARRQAAREAVRRLRAEREQVAATWALRRSEAAPAADAPTGADSTVRLDAVAAVETEAESVLATPDAAVDDAVITRLRALVARLQLSPPPRPPLSVRPSFICHDDTGVAPAAESR